MSVASALRRSARPIRHRAKRTVRRLQRLGYHAQRARDWRPSPPAVEWSPRPTEATGVTADRPLGVDEVSVFRAECFPASGPRPWLDRDDTRTLISQRQAGGQLTDWEAHLCRKWTRDGYVQVPGLLDDTLLDYVWEAYEGSIASGVVDPPADAWPDPDRSSPLPGRVNNPHLAVPEIAELMRSDELVRVVELLLGHPCIPFQSIIGHKASQQPAHSDSIHMTTYPEGYLVALWIAFEDIAPEAGPLEYYPGSHRLRTVYSRDVGISEDALATSGYSQFVEQYTPAIADIIEGRALKPEHFHARKGDVLFWHANLLHGGSPLLDNRLSRRALVFHYFAEGCICYHDLAAMAASVHTGKLSSPPRRATEAVPTPV